MSVRNALLALLSQKPRHGYELRAAYEAVVGDGASQLKPAQVYTTLERLEENGLIQRQSDLGEGDEPARRIYSLTSAGEAVLRQWFTSRVPAERQRDEFYIKLMVAIASGQADPACLIQTQRTYLLHDLQDLNGQRDGLDPGNELAQMLLIDKAIMHLEADLHWLDKLEARLESIRLQPFPEPEIRPRGRPRKALQS